MGHRVRVEAREAPRDQRAPPQAGGCGGHQVAEVDAAFEQDDSGPGPGESFDRVGLPSGPRGRHEDRHPLHGDQPFRVRTPAPRARAASALGSAASCSVVTPTITCRVAEGPNDVPDRGAETTATSSNTRTDTAAALRSAATVAASGVTHTSTTEPARTVAGTASAATESGTSVNEARAPPATAARGSSSPAPTSRPSTEPDGTAASAGAERRADAASAKLSSVRDRSCAVSGCP